MNNLEALESIAKDIGKRTLKIEYFEGVFYYDDRGFPARFDPRKQSCTG